MDGVFSFEDKQFLYIVFETLDDYFFIVSTSLGNGTADCAYIPTNIEFPHWRLREKISMSIIVLQLENGENFHE